MFPSSPKRIEVPGKPKPVVEKVRKQVEFSSANELPPILVRGPQPWRFQAAEYQAWRAAAYAPIYFKMRRREQPVRVRCTAVKCYNHILYGGYSSAAERLTVAQDVVGSIPTSRPKAHLLCFQQNSVFTSHSSCNVAQSGSGVKPLSPSPSRLQKRPFRRPFIE